MIDRFLNFKTLLGLIAFTFILGSILFSNYLAKKIAVGEKIKIEQYVEAVNDLNNINNTDTKLASKIILDNSKDIPLIQTNEKDSIIFSNYDSAEIATDKFFLIKKLADFKIINLPIVWKNPLNQAEKNFTYYGESDLLIEIRYFPIVQLIVATLFIIIIFIAISTKSKSTQNQVWVGLAKEAAHQLGTPISSLQGWMEMLKGNPATEKISLEMNKDVERLKLVSDRFGKIGSTPKLEETNLNMQVENMVSYIKKRSPEKIVFSINDYGNTHINAFINPHLFDWVIENLLKNALDAMDGKGEIKIGLKNEATQILIDVKDDGKGISKKNIANVFKPGFTTKQRGWGLGLSLSKRIIDIYHKGTLYVKHSEVGAGTTFRIVLRK